MVLKLKKLNLLFDTGVLKNISERSPSRSGIFFVTYNLLLEFIKSNKFNIFFHCDARNCVIFYDAVADLDCFNNCKIYPSFNFIEKAISRTYADLAKNKAGKKSKVKKFILKTKMIFLKSIMLFVKLKRCFFPLKYDFDKFDIYFSSMEKIPANIAQNTHIKKYTVLHDCVPILFEKYFPAMQQGKYWFLDLVNSINNNDYYFTVSENTKKDFLQYVPQIDTKKIKTTLLAAGDNFYPCNDKTKFQEVKQKYNIPEHKQYLFSLCSIEPRKNLIMAVKAFIAFIEKHQIDDFVYVLGGGAWKGFAEKMEQEIPDFEQYKDKIIKAGYVDDEDLASLYSNAEFFVYTSEYEGFGLPPLEAMKCGKAVITSNNSSLPEVVGDAGIMIDFDSLDQHINAIESLYFDIKRRHDYEAKSLQRAKLFSWSKCADIMIKEMINNA